LASAVVEGKLDANYDTMYQYLTNTLKVAPKEAEMLAKEFAGNVDSLSDYGAAVIAAKEQQQAAYDAIATNA
jgi:formylmethanofuran dehydrogenase subunit D